MTLAVFAAGAVAASLLGYAIFGPSMARDGHSGVLRPNSTRTAATPASTPTAMPTAMPTVQTTHPAPRPRRSHPKVMARRSEAGTSPVAASSPSMAAAESPSGAPDPTVAVSYWVESQGTGWFQGQVQVVNNTGQPISGWQIVIALPDDEVTSASGATGYDSNGIVLLQPSAGAAPVAAGGGALNVSFVALGTQTVPEACAFNGITCQ
jgi:Cellulose binding domain